MTIAHRDILLTAKHILSSGNTESDYRAAIGRSYYAAYHCCVELHANFSAPGIAAPAGQGGEHENLVHRLTHPTDDTNRARSRQLGYILRGMKYRRHDADYHLEKTISQQQAEQTLAEAERLATLAV